MSCIISLQVRFTPRRMLTAEVELVIHKASGGRWRFQIHLHASEPENDGVFTIESAMDQTSSIPIYLYSSSDKPVPFTANFTPDTPLSFDVRPTKGMLQPAPRDGSQGTPAMQVLYTCRDFGKIMKGRLFVQAGDLQYSYELRGRMPTYQPPKPSDFKVRLACLTSHES